MGKADSMQVQIGNVSKKMEILETTKKKCERLKKNKITCNRYMNIFGGLINTLDTAEKGI